MNIKDVWNYRMDTPSFLVDFVKKTKPCLEQAKTFRELESLASTIVPAGEEFFLEHLDPSQPQTGSDSYYMKSRIALALHLECNGVKVLIQRTESIYLGNEEDIPVNIGVLDALVASRVFIPGGENYGILGKIEALRGKNESYYDSQIEVSIDNSVCALEINKETSESCYMITGTIKTHDEDLINKILKDPNVMLCTAKV